MRERSVATKRPTPRRAVGEEPGATGPGGESRIGADLGIWWVERWWDSLQRAGGRVALVIDLRATLKRTRCLARRGRPLGAIGVCGVAVLGALLISSCGGASRSVSTASSSPFTATAGDTGCGARRGTGSTTLTPTIAGHRRTVIVHAPSGHTGATKTPLVLNLPGSGETALQQERLTGMDATSDSDGFIVAYPQALIPDGSGYDWNIPGVPLVGGRAVPSGAADDVAFLTKLPGYLEERYCIDPARVYVTGISGGGRMASQLACDASKVFAAVAPVAGLRRPTPCPTTRPVPVLAFHGTADPIDPYNGHGQGYWTYSVPQAEAYWASQDSCATTPRISRPAPSVTLTTYHGCHAGASVELYSITGEGHEWPGGPSLPASLTAILGPQTTAIIANSVMWAFFKAHPLLKTTAGSELRLSAGHPPARG